MTKYQIPRKLEGVLRSGIKGKIRCNAGASNRYRRFIEALTLDQVVLWEQTFPDARTRALVDGDRSDLDSLLAERGDEIRQIKGMFEKYGACIPDGGTLSMPNSDPNGYTNPLRISRGTGGWH